jgi:hypothetical protein
MSSEQVSSDWSGQLESSAEQELVVLPSSGIAGVVV